MALETSKPQPLSLRGEVVEIFREKGKCFAKITVETQNILDVNAGSIRETHLGDHLVIDAHITIESVKPE